MEAAVIDTPRYARRLRDAGVAPEQAEAMADALWGALVQDLVTKTDLNAALAVLEARLVWRLLGGVTVVVGLAVALIKLG